MQPETIARLKEMAFTSPTARKRLRRAGIMFTFQWPCHPDYVPRPPLSPRVRGQSPRASNEEGHVRTRRLKALGLIGKRHMITDIELAIKRAEYNKRHQDHPIP